jgi:hypothetical protein
LSNKTKVILFIGFIFFNLNEAHSQIHGGLERAETPIVRMLLRALVIRIVHGLGCADKPAEKYC